MQQKLADSQFQSIPLQLQISKFERQNEMLLTRTAQLEADALHKTEEFHVALGKKDDQMRHLTLKEQASSTELQQCKSKLKSAMVRTICL